MIILMWDGRQVECRKVEFSTDGRLVIYDDVHAVPIENVNTIVYFGKGGPKYE